MSSTPSGARIWADRSDGARTEVTEAVQILYDALIHSLDWGSGFLSSDEAIAVANLAEACGFDLTAAHAYLTDMADRNSYPPPNREDFDKAQEWLLAHTDSRGEPAVPSKEGFEIMDEETGARGHIIPNVVYLTCPDPFRVLALTRFVLRYNEDEPTKSTYPYVIELETADSASFAVLLTDDTRRIVRNTLSRDDD